MRNYVLLSDSDRILLDELRSEMQRMNDDKIPDVLLSCTETARYLCYSLATISTYIKQGKLTKRTKGNVTGIPLRDIMKMKRKNRREPEELPDS